MSGLSFVQLQDVVLIIFYKLAKGEVSIPATPGSFIPSFRYGVSGERDFLVERALEGLIEKKYLSHEHYGSIFSDYELLLLEKRITAIGLERIEHLLEDKESVASQHIGCPVNVQVGNLYIGNSPDNKDLITISLQRIPAAGRTVSLNHNSAAYEEAMNALDATIEEAKKSNQLGAVDPDERTRTVAELEAGKRVLQSQTVNVQKVSALLGTTLIWLATEFAAAPVGEAAQYAWSLIKSLVGL